MSLDTDEPYKQVLGYGFFDRVRPTSPGYAKLKVSLRDEPGHGYYSPEYLRVTILNEADKLEHLAIYHPWEDTETHQVGLDRIVLRDDKGRTIEAFTFGGTLTIVDKGSHTVCVLTSSAPILELVEDTSITNLLAEEAESAIAEFRDRQESVDFDQWFAQADPLKLYAASIKAIKQTLLDLAEPDVTQVQLLRLVSAEIKALRAGKFTEGLPELTQVA